MRTPFLASLLLLLASFAGAQTHSMGGVQRGQPILGPSGVVAYDFELCCGGPGKPVHISNGFDYDFDTGTFNLTYSGPGCLKACVFSGTNFQNWFSLVPISKYCEVQSATLFGNFQASTYYPEVFAEYSQVYCVEGANHWWSGGSLTVHLDVNSQP